MTAVLWDDVATRVPAAEVTARAPKLRAVPAPKATTAPAPKRMTKRLDGQPFGVGGDPLVEGAAWLLSAPVRQLYAALWRVGLLEVLT